MTTCTVFDIRSFSIHDGPGTRTTVFLKGCPLHCAWCHNPESISPHIEFQYWQERCIGCGSCIEACPTGALKIEDNRPVRDADLCADCFDCIDACPGEAWQRIGQVMTVEEVLDAVRKDVVCFDQSGGGVTFSGGEPLLQADALVELLRACGDYGIHTVVDTCGFAPQKALEQAAAETDLFLYDLKLMDSEKHRRYMGVPNQVILDNLRWLDAHGNPVIVRIPVIPGVNDDHQDLMEMIDFLGSLQQQPEVHLLGYHEIALQKYQRLDKVYMLRDVQPPTAEDMEKLRTLFENNGFRVTIGG